MLAELALTLDLKFYNKIHNFHMDLLRELAKVEVSMPPVSGKTECHTQTSGKY